MKRKTKVTSLLDIIFDNRNKDYGAFAIIKNSVRRIRISFITATGIFLLLILIIGGVIRMPWINYADVNQEYNAVSVKYDPSLITILSEPFKVEPKKEHQKIFTEPKIIDEERVVVPTAELKLPEKNLALIAKNEESRRDSLKAIEEQEKEKKLALAKAKADSVMFVEMAPQFPGGADALRLYISNNLKYPVDAINRKVQGTVVLNFIVEKDGSINRIIITKAVDPVLDFEAVRIISAMPHWQAAKLHGKPIAVMIVIPINFSLRQ